MDFKIPLFDLNFDEQEEVAVMDTLRSKWISTGPKCAEFEALFAKMWAVKHAVSLSNCTTALHLALKLVGVGAADEVICPSLTFVATVNAIKYVDAVPVFCDVKSHADLNIHASDIEKLITGKTKAIIVMHFAGFPCEMDQIMALAAKYKLKVIEDACHAPLSEYNGKKLGTIGDIGCFSFFSNKNISTGEGGMLITNNDEYASRCKLLRSHGMTSMSYQRAKGHATAYDVVELGYNYRMDDIRAAIGIVQLNKLEKDLLKRAEIRKYYEQKLSEIPGIIVPFSNCSNFVSNYVLPVILKDSTEEYRDVVRNKLLEKGIQTSVHYPAVHRFGFYQNERQAVLPNTEYVTDNEVTLPMYSRLTTNEIDYVTTELKNAIA